MAKRNTTFCPNQIKSYIIHRKRQGYESITTGNVRSRVTLGNMFDTIRNLCANMLLAATVDLLRTLFHFVGGRRYLQCFAASSSAAKTRGIGRTDADDRGRRESEKEANILQLQRRPYKRRTRKPSVYLCESCGHAGIALHLKGKETIAECATE